MNQTPSFGTKDGSKMKIHIDASSVNEAIVVISGTFDAPRELVWAAFTDPKHVVHWYGGHGFTNPVCEMDVRPGGTWHHVMRTPDGTDHTLDFVYVEVKKPERLVWQNKDYGKSLPGQPPNRHMTVTLDEAGKRTKWTLVARFDSFADRDTSVQMGFTRIIEQGSEKLNELVKRL
jgi:uncharacterized protein YndB with AHSA1/START domain